MLSALRILLLELRKKNTIIIVGYFFGNNFVRIVSSAR